MLIIIASICLGHALGQDRSHCKPQLQKRLLGARHADAQTYTTAAGSWIPGFLAWARPSESLAPCFSLQPAMLGRKLDAVAGCPASFQLALDEQCGLDTHPAGLHALRSAQVRTLLERPRQTCTFMAGLPGLMMCRTCQWSQNSMCGWWGLA